MKNPYYSKYLMESYGTTLDAAYRNYCDSSKTSEKKEALEFLIYILDINLPEGREDELNELIHKLMQEREAHKASNPDYIPNTSPYFLALAPAKRVIEDQTAASARDDEYTKLIELKELLDVTAGGRRTDRDSQTTMIDGDGDLDEAHEERAEFRVHLHKGGFYKAGEPFSTKGYVAHGKADMAAFTLNANGELSVFSHQGGRADSQRRRLRHSSMNNNAPVISAGEFKIEEGKLTEIVNYSGHYWPSLFNVHRLLQHFSSKGIDISDVKILCMKDPNIKGTPAEVVTRDGQSFYAIPATALYKKAESILIKSVASVNEYGNHAKKKHGLQSAQTLRKKKHLSLQLSTRLNDIFSEDTPVEMRLTQALELTNRYLEENAQLRNKGRLVGLIETLRDDIQTKLKEIKELPEVTRDIEHFKSMR